MKVLSRYEASILSALGETLFPARRASPIGYLDEFISRISARDRWLIKGSLILFELGIAAHRPGSNLRFSAAPTSLRNDYLHWCETSDVYPVRVGFLALRSIVTMAYVGDAEVRGR